MYEFLTQLDNTVFVPISVLGGLVLGLGVVPMIGTWLISKIDLHSRKKSGYFTDFVGID